MGSVSGTTMPKTKKSSKKSLERARSFSKWQLGAVLGLLLVLGFILINSHAAANPTFSHASLLAERTGYAKNATGGTTDCNVTSLANTGAGTLRACAEAGGQWVHFSVNGTITVTSSINVKSNTTI